MYKKTSGQEYRFRNVTLHDIKEVYKLLVANRPYVGLNSRYTYFLLAKDFSDTCIVAEDHGEIIGFSSGYVPPIRPDTFFNWEIVVDKNYRGNGLQKQMLLYQIRKVNAKFLEATVNPSNVVCKKNLIDLARLLHTTYAESIIFSEKDFDSDGHETEILYRVGPISQAEVESLTNSKNQMHE